VTPSTDEAIVVQGPLPDRPRNREAAVAVPTDSAASETPVAPAAAAIPRQGFIEAFTLGPVWLAARGLWYLFVVAAIGELIGLVTSGFAIRRILAGMSGGPQLLLLGIAVVVLIRSAFAMLAVRPRLLQLSSQDKGAHLHRQRAAFGTAMLVLAYVLTLWRFLGPALWQPLVTFPAPAALAPQVARAIDAAVKWAIVSFGAFFEAIRFCVFWLLTGIEAAFVVTPWPVTVAFLLLIAWRAGGLGVLIFAAGSLAYLGVFGFWEKSMSTLALVATSVIVCVAFGVPLGILCAKSRRSNAVIEPILDVMQTLPTFVYLIPAVAFFSIGKPPGVLATVIFAMPPMIRLTSLGIRQVPQTVKEAALAYGAGPLQLLGKVELPLAIPSILTGINQVIMMSLSMVVIAGLIGAGGLGLDVIRALNFLQTGQGFLAGIAIVLMAMMLDRIVRGSKNAGRGRRQ
jgi:ABC-type proline/glycine betaine transport system permease subunit